MVHEGALWRCLRSAALAAWCKARSSSGSWQALLVGASLAIAIAGLLGAAAGRMAAQGRPVMARGLASAETVAFGWHQIALVVALVAAATAVTGEYRHRVAPATALAVPHRGAGLLGTWLVHGAVSAVLSALLVPLLAPVAALAAQVPLASGSTATVPLEAPDPGALLLVPVVTLLLAAVAVGFAAVVRSSTVVVVALPVWFWFGEPLVGGAPGIGQVLGPLLPLRNAWHVLGVGDLPAPPWSPPAALLVLTVTGAVVLGIGTFAAWRRPLPL